MLILTILAQETMAGPESSHLDNFLKYGQMGLALAILVVGAGLFTAAVKQQNLSETTARVLKLFATVMVVLFVVSFLGEMATKVMDFLDKRTAILDKRSEFVVAIELPPLNRENIKKYPIEITVNDMAKEKQIEPVDAGQLRTFPVHDKTLFRIDLENLIDQLRNSQQLASSLVKETAPKKDAVGGGGPQ
jgi:hypothetical protein